MTIGFWQVILVLAVVLVLFGAGKIPKAMGDLGRGLRAFKKGLQEEGEATPLKKLPTKKPVKKPAAKKSRAAPKTTKPPVKKPKK